jgi:hypothetical protein
MPHLYTILYTKNFPINKFLHHRYIPFYILKFICIAVFCSKCLPLWLESQTDQAHVPQSFFFFFFIILWPNFAGKWCFNIGLDKQVHHLILILLFCVCITPRGDICRFGKHALTPKRGEREIKPESPLMIEQTDRLKFIYCV